jgi:twitching motility protein PilT
MKGVMGGKGSPLQKLVEGQWKDETEKQGLLAAVAADDSIKADSLLALVVSNDATVQQRGGTLFLTRADDNAASALLKKAIELEGAQRAPLVKLLGRVRAEILTPSLEMALKDTKEERLRTSWGIVMELPSEIGDGYLARALEEGPPATRLAAIDRLLKKNGAEKIRKELLATASDRDARVRRAAVDALLQLTGNDVFEAMLDRLSVDDNAEIRGLGGGYLQKFIVSAPADMRPTILGRLLLAGDPELQATLLKALFSTGSLGDLLLEILTFCKTILGIQHQTVMTSLKTLGDPLLQATLPLLTSQDADIRVQALLLVEKFGNPKTVGTIVKLLGDGDWWVRIMACETLGRMKDQRVSGHLEKMLTDADAKWAAIDALGAIGGDAAYTNLATLLRDPQPEVRLAALNAIANVDDKRVAGHVDEIAKGDTSLDVRIRAVELLRLLRGASGAAAGAAVTSAQLTQPMDKLLAYGREAGASDIHVTPGEPPLLRINGVLARLQSKVFTAKHTEALLSEILDPVRWPILQKAGAVDFCYSIAGVGRYRTNIFRQQRGMSGAFRCIPNAAPLLSGLGLPKYLDEINTYHQGIVLLTGPAGSGKSTSLAALVNVINDTRQAHVLTLEDPIEFLHPPKKALINQREIGRDSVSFAAAMRAALREDPDVIVVGEMRDRETIRLALLAAETGHLVIATMQTTGAVATVDKLVESFPTDEQQQVRVSLSGSLKLIISQQLVPRADGSGRAAVFEILKSTSPIRTLIREGKTFQLPSAMQIGRSMGMRTIDASLEEMLAAGIITLETAHANAEKKETFEKRPVAKGAPGAATPTSTVAAAAVDPGPMPSIVPPSQVKGPPPEQPAARAQQPAPQPAAQPAARAQPAAQAAPQAAARAQPAAAAPATSKRPSRPSRRNLAAQPAAKPAAPVAAIDYKSNRDEGQAPGGHPGARRPNRDEGQAPGGHPGARKPAAQPTAQPAPQPAAASRPKPASRNDDDKNDPPIRVR